MLVRFCPAPLLQHPHHSLGRPARCRPYTKSTPGSMSRDASTNKVAAMRNPHRPHSLILPSWFASIKDPRHPRLIDRWRLCARLFLTLKPFKIEISTAGPTLELETPRHMCHPWLTRCLTSGGIDSVVLRRCLEGLSNAIDASASMEDREVVVRQNTRILGTQQFGAYF